MIEVDCQISIKKNGVSFLNAARTELLKEVALCGSLSAAAKKLKISYQHAWNLIDEMNKQAPEPLVNMQRGGANGGGAVLTVYGERILREYGLIEKHLKRVVSQINVEINL